MSILILTLQLWRIFLCQIRSTALRRKRMEDTLKPMGPMKKFWKNVIHQQFKKRYGMVMLQLELL
ncbi:MAG TPA: hypothetical protein DHV41_01560 [Parachlamydiales bacterium]|nr:MAG: hypothetical protein A2098_02230 [Chlamydiae bacterium GWF2_49_8]HCJ84087.1 hypothetical protein [Parachlamydiales bacterium]